MATGAEVLNPEIQKAVADALAGVVRDAEAEAQAKAARHGRALALIDFMAVERPPLEYHVAGVLPTEGKVLISAAEKAGKTFLATEIGLCLAAGHCEFLGLEFRAPARVLFVQYELSDSLLEDRLRWIVKTAPPWLDLDRARENFIVCEQVAAPDLAKGEGREAFGELLEDARPDVVIIDPLYRAFVGLSENDADAVGVALDFLSRVAAVHHVALIVTHHFGKARNGPRGSSVLSGWPETAIQVHGIEEEPDVLKADALLRCAFGGGWPRYWRRLTEASPWFESMPSGWEPEKTGGRGRKATPEMVATCLQAAKGPGLSHTNLSREVAGVAGCSERTAKRAIADAVGRGLIVSANGIYAIPRGAVAQ